MMGDKYEMGLNKGKRKHHQEIVNCFTTSIFRDFVSIQLTLSNLTC